MKQTKAGSGLRFLWLYLLLSVVIIAGLWLILDPPGAKVHYMDKTDMFDVVRNNRQTILEDIGKNEFTRTLDLLSSSREEPHVYFADNCVTFYCYGFGFGPSTSYEGFYYTPWDGPGWVGGGEPPWQMYSVPEGENLIEALKQEGNEWVWYEKDINAGGDNEYHTEKICDNFWYYKLYY